MCGAQLALAPCGQRGGRLRAATTQGVCRPLHRVSTRCSGRCGLAAWLQTTCRGRRHRPCCGWGGATRDGLQAYPGSSTSSCNGSCAVAQVPLLVKYCMSGSGGVDVRANVLMPWPSTTIPPLPAMFDCPASTNKSIFTHSIRLHKNSNIQKVTSLCGKRACGNVLAAVHPPETQPP